MNTTSPCESANGTCLRQPWIVAILIVLGIARSASAQDGSAYESSIVTDEEGHGRDLRGHLFIPSQLVIDPFATTYFRSTTGAGYATSNAPRFDRLGDRIGDGDFDQAALAQTFELQIAPLRWLAVRAGGTAVAYSGVNAGSVLALGATVALGVTGGVTITPPDASWFRPAIVVDVQHGPAYGLTLLETLRSSIAAREIVREDAIETGSSTLATPGLSAAVALHRAVGVVGEVRYVLAAGESIGAALDRDGYSLGLAVDLDLNAISFLPLGVGLAGRWLDRWTRAAAEKEVNLGFFYTARANLVLGLVGGVRHFPQGPRVDSTVSIASVTMRYYW